MHSPDHETASIAPRDMDHHHGSRCAGVDTGHVAPQRLSMQIHLTSEEEAQLSELATHHGTDAEHLVREAALRLLQNDLRFREGGERVSTHQAAVNPSSTIWSGEHRSHPL